MDLKNKRIAKNTFFLVIRTIISLVITLYTTRVVLKELGVDDFGVFSLIYGVVALFTFINTSMNESVQRYFSIYYGRKEFDSLGGFFKSSIVLYILIGLFFLAVMLFIKNYVIFDFLNISEAKRFIASEIYMIAVIGILFSVLQTPFNSLVLAAEEMSFYAYVSIFESLLKLLASLAIGFVTINKLYSYTLLLLASSGIIFLTYLFFSVFKFKSIIFHGAICLSKIKELFYFSFWNILGNFSTVLRIQGVNILINLFFSTTANAAYAVSNSINGALNSLSNSLNIAIKPQIYKAYATGDYERYSQLVVNGSKLTFTFLFILCLPIFINLDGILSIWLVEPPKYTYFLTLIVLSVSLIDSFSFPLMAALQATGRIKLYQVIVSSITIASVPAIYLLYYFGFSLYSLGIILMLSSVATLFVRISLLNRMTILNQSVVYKKSVFPCLLGAIISGGVAHLYGAVIKSSGIVEITLSSFFIDVVCLLVFYFVIFDKTEKQLVNNFVLINFNKVFRNN
ncbi:MATE family efflux transporter [Raoultella terrigena]|uniref:MATE family efflux transporter n=1 Tax=Raoultella terrigena TaxID=577 RepID=UPI003BF48896